jgi:hypothetical protein
MRNLPRLLSLSLIALPATLLLSACGGQSAGTSSTPSGTSAPSTPLPQAAAPDQGNTPATPGAPQPQADAGNDAIQPSDYRPDPTYLPDDSHLGQSS